MSEQLNLADKAHNLAEYWRSQAQYWDNQVKQWHEVVLFCREVKSDLEVKSGITKSEGNSRGPENKA